MQQAHTWRHVWNLTDQRSRTEAIHAVQATLTAELVQAGHTPDGQPTWRILPVGRNGRVLVADVPITANTRAAATPAVRKTRHNYPLWATCRAAPDRWSIDGSEDGAGSVPGAGRQMKLAMHICLTHCPVLDLCRRYARVEPSMVVAGVAYQADSRPHRIRHPTRRCRMCQPTSRGDR